jgi:protein involved in polysaccharide export with SLBB domain
VFLNKSLTYFLVKTLSVLAVVILALNSLPSYSQSLQPTQQQISQFKNLSPEEQEALAKQLGIDISILSSSSQSADKPESVSPELVNRKVDELSISKSLSKQSIAESQSSELKPFGYDLFNSSTFSTASAQNTPVPSDYLMGPGDSINLQLYGKESGSFELFVNNEGAINIPDLGQVIVTGLTYSEAKQLITGQYAQKKIGVQAFVTMGKQRTIQVVLVGEVYRPGTLTVNSLATLTTALFNSGGVSEIGSLRNIQLKRNGKVVTTFDFYQLIVFGDNSSDMRLQQGDVIFVPTIKNVVSIDGKVRRPGIYEMLPGDTFDDLLTLSGGALPNADISSIQLVRNSVAEGLQITSIDTSENTLRRKRLKNGDYVSVSEAKLEFTNAVRIVGAVNLPELVSITQHKTLSSLVTEKNILNNTDMGYGLLLRTEKLNGVTKILQFSPRDILNGVEDYALQSLDQVLLFSRISEEPLQDNSGLLNTDASLNTEETALVANLESDLFTVKQIGQSDVTNFSRQQLLAPVLARIKSESSTTNTTKLVEVKGSVRFPGRYPLAVGMSIQDLLDAAGGLSESAYLESAELTRIALTSSSAEITHITVNLQEQLKLPNNKQLTLASKDVLTVVSVPDLYENKAVTLGGQFRFPGNYQVKKGETLKDLILRAGGLTSDASLEGAIFTRKELREKERENIDAAVETLRQQIANNNLSNSQFTKSVDYQNAKEILSDLTSAKPIGRLVVDLEKILSDDSEIDIVLKDGDMILVPNITPAISVIGEVFVPATHLYDQNVSVRDYIEKAGGIKQFGDSDNIYVVRANGSVEIVQNNFWFSKSQNTNVLKPGDTIVVPRDVTNFESLGVWQGVTQIVYQTAVAVAAIGSL